MQLNRQEAITKLLKKHPHHRGFIGQVLNELAEENIRTSIKQAFLGCSESELHELADFAHGYEDIPPVIETPAPAPVVVPEVNIAEESHAIKPVTEQVQNANVGKNKRAGNKSSKR